MAMDSAGCLKMARLVAIAQIVIAGLLFVFGIAELLVDERSFTAYAGFGIWNGIWLAITGGLGIPGTSRERTSRSNAFAGVYMGFSITSAVFAGVSIICYSLALTFSYGHVRRYQLQAPFALAVVMLIFSIVNFVLGIWAAVCCCSLATCECCATSALQDTQMVYMANPGMPAGGYVIAQGPGAVPVAVPVQEGGGAGMVAVQVPTSTVMGQQTQTLSHNPQVAYVPVSGQMVPAGAMGGQAQYVQYGTGPSYTATGVNQSQKQIPAKQ